MYFKQTPPCFFIYYTVFSTFFQDPALFKQGENGSSVELLLNNRKEWGPGNKATVITPERIDDSPGQGLNAVLHG